MANGQVILLVAVKIECLHNHVGMTNTIAMHVVMSSNIG